MRQGSAIMEGEESEALRDSVKMRKHDTLNTLVIVLRVHCH